MVQVYNCHPFASQQIVQVEQEPGLVCCGGGALFVVASGGCKVEAYNVDQEGCPLICRFATMGTVKSIHHSNIGDYLVTIEEKNNATYLRAYTNWRCQAEEKARVGVRLLGHLLRGASVRGGTQMEIIEIPMSVRPLAVACCPLTGDLVVGCAGTLVLFTLRRQNQLSLSQQNIQPLWQSSQQNPSLSQGQNSSPNPNISVLDFERSVILHLPGLIPHQVSLCGAFVAVQAELEVLVLRLDGTPDPKNKEESPEKYQRDYVEDPPDFLLLPRHQELLGDRARESGLLVTMEKTGLEDKGQQYTLSYVLYRRFAPDFFLGCSVEETRLHSLQLHPLFTSKQSVGDEEPACVFCFFSLPTTGYLYSLRGGVELLSTYQYPEKALEAVLTNQFLHVITKNALQCFSVRCAAVAARAEDPYIDTTMRACPPCTLEVCALRMQLFIGLRAVCVYGRHVILFSSADAETPEEAERSTQRRSMSKKWASTRPRESSSSAGHGWNLYVIHTVSPIELYHEMLEYSRRYAETNPQPQSCCHLLSEAHLLLRAALLSRPPGPGSVKPSDRGPGAGAALLSPLPGAGGSVKPSLSPPPGAGGSVNPSDSPNNSDDCTHAERDTDTRVDGHTDRETERQELEDAFKENCAQLGDCFSRSGQRDCHLALPYYRMSDLSITDVIARNRPLPSSPCSYGPGFLFYLKHFLLEDADQILSQEAADEVMDVFSQSEPSQLVSVCASPGMANSSPAVALVRLQHVEDTAGVSVPLTLTMATMALRLGNLPQYTQLITRHAEMLLVYGFIEEPRLLLHWGQQGDTQTMVQPTAALTTTHLTHTQTTMQPTALTTHLTHTQTMMQPTDFTTHLTHTQMTMQPTALTTHLTHTQPGLLVAAMVALHENNKVQLEQADRIFKDLGCEDGLLVDFWEAVLMASSQDTIIHELLFRLASVYIERLTQTKPDARCSLTQTQPDARLTQTQPDARSSLPHAAPVYKSLKTAEDLINSCSHYGILYPWLSVLTPALTTTSQQQEALHKLQSLLCGPSLSVGSVVPLVDRVSEEDSLWGLSLHVLCATRRGQYETSMEKLLDRCPQAIIPYANHQLQDTHMALWWQKLLPELCERTRAASDNAILLAALKETLVVVAMETTPTEFLELLPDDGTALYFLPHLLACSQKHLLA